MTENTLDQEKLAGAMAQMRTDEQALVTRDMDEVLTAGIDLGRLEALDFLATVANSAILSIYENVKKSKAWRLLRNPQSGDGRHFASLDEFCEVKLGKSYKRMRELALNRNVLGQDAFEQAERLGLHQRDFNAIKALPAPDQELVRRAVEDATSREEVLDLLQELASRHGQVQEELMESRKDKAATEQLLADKSKRIDQLKAAQKRIQSAPLDVQLIELKKEATAIAADAEGAIEGGLRQALIDINNHGDERGQHDVFLAGLVGQVQAQLNTLRKEFDLPDVSNATDQRLAAEMAEWDKAEG